MIDKALEIAGTSQFKQFKTGCVITYQGHIISSACNSDKTSPAQKKYNKYRNFTNNKKHVLHKNHAEIAAIKKINPYHKSQINWSKVNIYIARIALGLPNKTGYSRPCAACLAAIKDMGIKNVFYTTQDGIGYERISD